ncbi:hypothetical protein R3P38DRAFT_3268313 [Favolaschia claudopus]|uniref:Uncharacterized protein n=1 Tax=Favolaschia claudopus TaxID=2862362 RepID=A0AAW0BJT8_9AGAR
MSSNYVYNIAPSRFQPGSRSALPAAAPQAPTVARKQRVKKRNLGTPARLPEGYAFIPPANPLVFPSTYHLIEAGPMNERPRRKRFVLGVLTNAAERVLPKRKEPKVIDSANKEWLRFVAQTKLLTWQPQSSYDDGPGFGMRSVFQCGMRDGGGVRFRHRAGFSLTGDTYGGGAGLLVGSVSLMVLSPLVVSRSICM